MTVITPEQSAWQRSPYIPAGIRLEAKAKTERSTLAIIQETMDAEAGLDKERVAAEQAIVDELVSFVDSFGDDFWVEETGLDSFWEERQQDKWSLSLFDRPLLSPLSMTSTLVQSPPPTGVPRRRSRYESKGYEEPSGIDLHDLITKPSFDDLRRDTYAVSEHSGSCETLTSASPQFAPPAVQQISSSPLPSPGLLEAGGPVQSPKKAKQARGKGGASAGQKVSLRDLIRNAVSMS